jgi:formylglycine-generating enzyme required for sulfatase activity
MLTPRSRDRLLREACAAAALNHPNIVSVLDAGEFEGTSYIVMELCHGPNLARWLRERREPVPPRLVARIALSLCDAVGAAHLKEIVHRDIKPNNVLLFPSAHAETPDSFPYCPKLTDFGLALPSIDDPSGSASRLTLDGVILGTPAYMAPEQIRGKAGGVGYSCDIYSIGVILYELLTGQLPYDGPAYLVGSIILTQDATPPSDLRPQIDPELEAICLKAMAKEIADRYASINDLASALSAYLGHATAFPRSPDGDAASNSGVHEAEQGSLSIVGRQGPAASRRPDELKPARRWGSVLAAAGFPTREGRDSRPRMRAWGGIVIGLIVGLVALGGYVSQNRMERGDRDDRGDLPGNTTRSGDRAESEAPSAVEFLSPFTQMKMIRIRPGEFIMGSPDDGGATDEHPNHRVRISRPFWLGKYEVTQDEYQKVTGQNPNPEPGDGRWAVGNVSWFDAVKFCNLLSAREGLPPFYKVEGDAVVVPDWGGIGYRLPTEAEWEYACRSGTEFAYSFSDHADHISDYAWFDANSEGKLQEVGLKRPNAWGLHDMHGNKWEWCWDEYDDYAASLKTTHETDPTGPNHNPNRRTLRGGGLDAPWFLRSAQRNWREPGLRIWYVTFRVAKTIAAEDETPARAFQPSFSQRATSRE